MNNNDFEIILDLATRGERYSAEEFAATRAAEVEMAARLTPITAEALLADGWRWDTQDREYTLTIEQRWTLYYDIEYSCLQVHCWEWESSVVVRGLSNMHDLRELVGLLGGAQ